MINQIHNMDCLEGMKLLQDKSVDMILCDLPYGVTKNEWDVIIPFNEMWEQYERIIKDNGAIVLTATQPFATKLIASNCKLFRYDLIWRKNISTGHLNAKKMPLRNHEYILVFYKKLPTYNPQKTVGHVPVHRYTNKTAGNNYGKTKEISGGGQTDRYPNSIIDISAVNNGSKERIHPTQKPVELFEWLIKSYTNENEIILDNCIGSGTTAVAAIKTNRNFIGFEISEEYCAAANERINNLNQVLQAI
ncbi:cytosine methyltransferase [Bacillus toyonensis]|uniref:Methyltransferase n=1 Tax=Bacillus toyonensis TaxID=155322 RepID=A0AAP8F362_9BACI|nr:site-specific DNA-methyltransferase [Bacillus toyonensis]PHE13388.1 cytosine methyltransferase [Bacillus toyonensis]